ncbi:hypothetical protein J4230_03950 [Candidatus Woesearchaeota archaeon]|nr:hypothetical protein [Candidatus Woesearchaeota archaeon]
MTAEQTYSPEEILFDITSRVRSLEGKYNLLRDRVLIINNNMVEEYKKLMSEVRIINEDLKEIKQDVFKIKESIRHLVKETELFSRKEDVQFLEKYINFWNPMKFVTEEDVMRILEHYKSKGVKKEYAR